MSQLRTLDREIVKALIPDKPTHQKDLASDLDAKPEAVAKSIDRLAKSGIAVLNREGQHQVPRLAVYDMIDRVKSSLVALTEATT